MSKAKYDPEDHDLILALVEGMKLMLPGRVRDFDPTDWPLHLTKKQAERLALHIVIDKG